MSDLIMCIMAFLFGVIFATIIWLFMMLKLNNSWADDCKKVNQEWGEYCTKMITRIFDDIEQQDSSVKKEGDGEMNKKIPASEYEKYDKFIKDTESCEDAIDRQALRARFNHLDEVYVGMSEEEKHEAYIYGQIIRAIDAAPPVTLKQMWIPLTWDESKCNSSFPDDMDGCWAIFTDGKHVSVERAKKDAMDHFFPSCRWFEMSDAVAWMLLPEPYKEVEE